MCVASHFSTILGIHLPGPEHGHSFRAAVVRQADLHRTNGQLYPLTWHASSHRFRWFSSIFTWKRSPGDQLVRGQAQCGFRKVPRATRQPSPPRARFARFGSYRAPSPSSRLFRLISSRHRGVPCPRRDFGEFQHTVRRGLNASRPPSSVGARGYLRSPSTSGSGPSSIRIRSFLILPGCHFAAPHQPGCCLEPDARVESAVRKAQTTRLETHRRRTDRATCPGPLARTGRGDGLPVGLVR